MVDENAIKNAKMVGTYIGKTMAKTYTNGDKSILDIGYGSPSWMVLKARESIEKTKNPADKEILTNNLNQGVDEGLAPYQTKKKLF